MPLLTDDQVREWRDIVQAEYVAATKAMARAAYREMLYRRYIAHHHFSSRKTGMNVDQSRDHDR